MRSSSGEEAGGEKAAGEAGDGAGLSHASLGSTGLKQPMVEDMGKAYQTFRVLRRLAACRDQHRPATRASLSRFLANAMRPDSVRAYVLDPARVVGCLHGNGCLDGVLPGACPGAQRLRAAVAGPPLQRDGRYVFSGADAGLPPEAEARILQSFRGVDAKTMGLADLAQWVLANSWVSVCTPCGAAAEHLFSAGYVVEAADRLSYRLPEPLRCDVEHVFSVKALPGAPKPPPPAGGGRQNGQPGRSPITLGRRPWTGGRPTGMGKVAAVAEGYELRGGGAGKKKEESRGKKNRRNMTDKEKRRESWEANEAERLRSRDSEKRARGRARASGRDGKDEQRYAQT